MKSDKTLINFIVPKSDAQKFRAIAKKRGVYYSQILRDLINSEISKSA
jgi:hypothetical protein